MVKIDRSFVEELPKNQPNQDRIREIATKARELGIRTIAEFVSDAASMSILFSAGVDYVEGNFLAGAAPEIGYDFELRDSGFGNRKGCPPCFELSSRQERKST